jgi:hypothetical protein
MEFCSPFDEELARSGPAAIFVLNTSGQWRLGPDLTRDGRGRHPEPPALDPAFALFRDRTTGLVTWFYVTARALLEGHPRGDARFYPTEEEARAALAAIGPMPVDPEPWAPAEE